MAWKWIAAALASALLAAAPASAQTNGSGLPPSVASAGVTQDQWDATLARSGRLASELGMTQNAVRNLAITYLGAERRLPFGEAVQQLDAALRALAAHRADVARAAPILPPALLAQRAQAIALVDQGMLREARSAYAALIAQARASVSVPARSHAELLAESAGLASIDGDFAASASLYGAAADLAADTDIATRWWWRNSRANQLTKQGERTGREVDLRAAVREFETQVVPLTSRQTRPLEWASTQNDLALPLRMLGEMGDDVAAQRAIDALQGARQVRTRDGYPNEWAMITINLGIARSALAQRSGDAGLLQQGIEDIESAMTLRARERDPSLWATAQQNLAAAYQVLADVRRDPALLRRAIAGYDSAREVVTRDSNPQQWAQIGNNLGAALRSLALLEGDAAAAQRSVEVLRGALGAFDANTNRVGWSRTQANLGASLVATAERGRPQDWPAAFQAFQAALSVIDRNSDGLSWAMVQVNLADAHEARGDATRNPADYQAALAILAQVRPVLERYNDAGYLAYVADASVRIQQKASGR